MASVRKRTWGNGQGGRKADGRKAGESWEAQWQDGGKQRRKAGFRLQADALAYAVARQKEVNDGMSRPEGHKKTISQLSVEFLAYTESRVERRVIGPGHLINMRGHFRNYIARATDYEPPEKGNRAKSFSGSIGSMTLASVRPSSVEKFRDDLFAAGLSSKGVRAIIITLHQALDLARRRDYVATNAADRIKIEKPRAEKNERVTPPSVEGIQDVISAARGAIKLAIELSASSGIRAGELRALRYRHLDFKKRTLTVKVALNVKNEEGPPKSMAGYREIPLSPLMIEKIEAHRASALKQGNGALVFPPDDGWAFIPPGWLRHRLKTVLRDLGHVDNADIDDPCQGEEEDEESAGFTWHSIRHYAISSWIAQGLGLKAVQTFAGHADVATTWNRYGHLFPDEDHWAKITAATDVTLKVN